MPRSHSNAADTSNDDNMSKPFRGARMWNNTRTTTTLPTFPEMRNGEVCRHRDPMRALSAALKILSACVFSVFVIGCAESRSPTAPTSTTPIITGQWTGSYAVASCTENAPGFCAALGSGGGMVFTPNQSGTAITGTLGIGAFNIPVSGSIGPDRAVVLAGSGPVASGATLTLTTWRTLITGSTMTGPLTYSMVLGSNLANVTANATLTKP